jgi:hypothetical protein
MIRFRFLVVASLVVGQALAFTDAEVQKMNVAIEHLCPLIEQQAVLQLEIKLERQNPAGVIDLRRLHESGRLLQITQTQIRDESQENRVGLKLFRRFAKKPLDVGFCVAHRESLEAKEKEQAAE